MNKIKQKMISLERTDGHFLCIGCRGGETMMYPNKGSQNNRLQGFQKFK